MDFTDERMDCECNDEQIACGEDVRFMPIAASYSNSYKSHLTIQGVRNCVWSFWHCDGADDCGNGVDEDGC